MSRKFKAYIGTPGFSLIELLFAVAVVGVISAIALFYLSAGRNEELVLGSTNQVLGLLRDARGRTLASKNGVVYGVHFDADKAVLFPTAYSAGAAGNETVLLDSAVEIASVSLAGGGSDVVFKRLTGKTTQSGTLVVRLKSDTSKARTISVSSAGVISSQ